MCVCVCVCVQGHEREGGAVSERSNLREGGRGAVSDREVERQRETTRERETESLEEFGTRSYVDSTAPKRLHKWHVSGTHLTSS